MDLDEYLWRNKIKQKDFCKKVQIRPHTLSLLVQKKHTTKLYIAINIHKATNGQVTYEELLRDEDKALLIDKFVDLKNVKSYVTEG